MVFTACYRCSTGIDRIGRKSCLDYFSLSDDTLSMIEKLQSKLKGLSPIPEKIRVAALQIIEKMSQPPGYAIMHR